MVTAVFNNLKKMILPCLLSMILNFVGVLIGISLGYPVFFDTFGTILISALSGYLPGFFVAFMTAAVCGIFDHISYIYCTEGIFIAFFTSYFVKKGLFSKKRGMIELILLFAFVNTASRLWLITFFQGKHVIESYSFFQTQSIAALTGLNVFKTNVLIILIADIINKTVSITSVSLALKYLPEKAKDFFKIAQWKQNKLNLKEIAKIDNTKVRKISLRIKVPLFFGAIITLVAFTASFAAYNLYLDSAIKNRTELATTVVKMAASTVKPQFVDRYLETRYKTGSYLRTCNELEAIQKSSPEIKYVYVYKILEDGCHVVFDLDPEGLNLGDIQPFDESFMERVPLLLEGKPIDPIITDDSYGWLLTIYEPIYDDQGVCKCYAGVDISMDILSSNAYLFWGKLILTFLGFFILICIYGHHIAEYNFTLPINAMALESGNFAYNTEEERAKTLRIIRNLDIRTGDEIENLYIALTKMTSDAINYISDLQKKNQIIEKMQSGLILVMAELVESRDKNTGDHIRKTSSYVRIITKQMKKEGIYKDAMNDNFIQEVIKSAPLHDIGKIHIPDAVLNKPGKLTNEEFDLMKTHTTIGREIIDNVIKIVPDPGYLKEARNLAAYHHEKWNGSGYPEGLKENEIPLSARIMAVADVFDALVSKRSYKEGFPFEKAISIIREGIGTHFDPEVVKAFLDAEDEVKEVMNNHSNMII